MSYILHAALRHGRRAARNQPATRSPRSSSAVSVRSPSWIPPSLKVRGSSPVSVVTRLKALTDIAASSTPPFLPLNSPRQGAPTNSGSTGVLHRTAPASTFFVTVRSGAPIARSRSDVGSFTDLTTQSTAVVPSHLAILPARASFPSSGSTLWARTTIAEPSGRIVQPATPPSPSLVTHLSSKD